MNETEGMGTVVYGAVFINVELTTIGFNENLRRCETFIADAYADGLAWSGERITTPCKIIKLLYEPNLTFFIVL